MVDQTYPRLIPIQGPRGGGKTFLAKGWVKQTALVDGVKKIVIADRWRQSLLRFREELVFDDHATFLGRIKLFTVVPQGDEFSMHGHRYDAAVCENIDLWPLVRQDPADPHGPMISVLMEEILAYTHGPVLCTFTDRVGLAQQLFPSEMAHALPGGPPDMRSTGAAGGALLAEADGTLKAA